MNESQLTRDLCRKINERKDALALPLVAGKMTAYGMPDRLIVYGGNTHWVEFKGHGGRTSLRQVQRLKQLAVLLPNRVWVARFSKDGKQIFIRGTMIANNADEFLRFLNISS